jgi:hypothetical protein
MGLLICATKVGQGANVQINDPCSLILLLCLFVCILAEVKPFQIAKIYFLHHLRFKVVFL